MRLSSDQRSSESASATTLVPQPPTSSPVSDYQISDSSVAIKRPVIAGTRMNLAEGGYPKGQNDPWRRFSCYSGDIDGSGGVEMDDRTCIVLD